MGGWLAELLGLPPTRVVRDHHRLPDGPRHRPGRRAPPRPRAGAGWDVEARGLTGAPPIRLLANGDYHVTLGRAVRLLGLGTDSIVRIETDGEGSMRPDALRAALAAADGPAIVCAQAGEVNSGAFDPLDAVCDVAAEHGAWVHVDGAFGLWARRRASHRHLVAGVGARRLVGHRRAQVAQRPLRRRAGLRRASAGPPRGVQRQRRLPADRGARRDGLDAGLLAPRALVRDLGRAALARARRRRRAGRALLRVRAALRRGAGRRGRGRGPQRRRAQPGPRPLRRRRRRHRRRGRRACRPRAPAGRARRRGAAGARCVSRSPTGRRRSPTSIARAQRSSPRRAR